MAHIIDSIDFHGLHWISLWQYPNNKDASSFYGYMKYVNPTSFKIRLFDHHFYNVKFKKYNSKIYLYHNDYLKFGKPLSFMPDDQHKLVFIINTKIESKYEFNIIHFYNIKQCITLCTLPDARTLVKSYKNNHNDTESKLQFMCPNKQLRKKIKEYAFFLVESNYGE